MVTMEWVIIPLFIIGGLILFRWFERRGALNVLGRTNKTHLMRGEYMKATLFLTIILAMFLITSIAIGD
jgi:hypothetical protein